MLIPSVLDVVNTIPYLFKMSIFGVTSNGCHQHRTHFNKQFFGGLYILLPLDGSQKYSVGHIALYSNLVINNYLWNTDGRTELVTSGIQSLIMITVHSEVQQGVGVYDGLLRIYSVSSLGKTRTSCLLTYLKQ